MVKHLEWSRIYIISRLKFWWWQSITIYIDMTISYASVAHSKTHYGHNCELGMRIHIWMKTILQYYKTSYKSFCLGENSVWKWRITRMRHKLLVVKIIIALYRFKLRHFLVVSPLRSGTMSTTPTHTSVHK